ncbi:hypothetical protein FOA43_004388 [Brettanomyces nanus]|uniref:Protein STU1 n=1 Tax=Eeniella nana TaxID=13502 RepID=A0A875SEA8_EENNA|nr:uncharacterized protein FOA43_004388 [Brettanomyces nanus]QPG76994.1 hypothetical protein FOA43_004388 [Brettanomyces nanus]
MNGVDPTVLNDSVISHNVESSLQLVLQLKDHIKHEQVDLQYAQGYFDSLLLAFREPRLSIPAFSTICHLIKRVRIQRPSDLRLVHSKVVPFLFERLKEPKASIRNASMKAMVTVWESIPEEFEVDLKQRGFKNSDRIIRAGLLDMVAEIVKNSPEFSLLPFLPSVVCLLTDQDQTVVESASNLLVLYFNSGSSQNSVRARTELVNQLSSRHVTHTMSMRLLSRMKDSQRLVTLYKKRLTGSSSMSSDRTMFRSSSTSAAQQHQPPPPSSSSVSSLTNLEKIDCILATFPGFESVERLPALNFTSSSQLLESTKSWDGVFEGRETEQNWIKRDKIVKQLQSMLRGNAVNDYPEVLGQVIRSFKSCISKAALSLRTTLSSGTCQLCKELGMHLGKYLDGSTVDYLLASLLKLTYATKTIAHQRANLAILSLIRYANISPRMIIQIHSTSQDKNAQPRIYAASWIEIFLLKYAGNAQVIKSAQEYVDQIIEKGICDPMPSIREATRNTFWTLNNVCPENAQEILGTLSLSMVKALERSRGDFVRRFPRSRNLSHLASSKHELKSTEPRNPVRVASEDMKSKKYVPQSLHNTSGSAIRSIPFSRSNTRPPSRSVSGSYLKTGVGSRVAPEVKTEKIRREDAIYDMILSGSQSTQFNGIVELLKCRPGKLPVKFSSMLNKLTITNPSSLLPIFQDGESFKYMADYLSTDNIIRMCCFFSVKSQHSLSQLEISFILHSVPIDDMCLGVTNILMLCVDSSKLLDLNLSMQFVKYKQEFSKSCFDLISSVFANKSIRIEHRILSSVCEALLKCWEFSDRTEGSNYLNLLCAAMNKNKPIFQKCLSLADDDTMKQEVAEKLKVFIPKANIDQFEYSASDEEVNNFDESHLDGLTMVVRKDIGNNQVSDIETDMTMIMPKFKKSLPQQQRLSDGSVSNNENEDRNPFLDTEKAVTVNAAISVCTDNDGLGDEKMDPNLSKGDSSDTTPDMNRLTLTEETLKLEGNKKDSSALISPPRSSTEVESILELADPLAPLTDSSGKFSIYQDKFDYSKKIEELDSWYDFASFRIGYLEQESDIPFKHLLEKMGQGSISTNELYSLVYAIQGDKEIKCDDVECALLSYVNPEIANECLFVSLFLMRCCMKRTNGSRKKEIFEKLVELCKKLDENEDELYFAIQETMELVSNVEYYAERLEDKRSEKLTIPQTIMLLEVLYSVMSPSKISYENVFTLDILLFKKLKSNKTMIRKLAVMIYAKFYKYKEKSIRSRDGDQLIDDTIFNKLEEPQLQLIKCFSKNVK